MAAKGECVRAAKLFCRKLGSSFGAFRMYLAFDEIHAESGDFVDIILPSTAHLLTKPKRGFRTNWACETVRDTDPA